MMQEWASFDTIALPTNTAVHTGSLWQAEAVEHIVLEYVLQGPPLAAHRPIPLHLLLLPQNAPHLIFSHVVWILSLITTLLLH